MAAALPPFQAFTILFKGKVDRIITTVHTMQAFDPTRPPTPPPPVFQANALWDSGASRSVISSRLVSTLGLQPVGATKVNHAGGEGTSKTYLVNFGLPNNVGIAGVLVTEFPAIAGGFDVIIGMDIISHGDFSLTNLGGRTCMSFRTPSCAVVDYVEEARRLSYSSVGRNDPCPCGKKREDGRSVKFKHCHGQ